MPLVAYAIDPPIHLCMQPTERSIESYDIGFSTEHAIFGVAT